METLYKSPHAFVTEICTSIKQKLVCLVTQLESPMASLRVFFTLVVMSFLSSTMSQALSGLFPEFYEFSCPQANEIVMSVLEEAISKDPRMAASLLRLHFHDCFVQSGGPHWEVPLGRRDSKVANLKKANINIPPPNSTIHSLIKLFAQQGLDEEDLVALSGAHTIGMARCVSFRQRLYNQKGDNLPDATLEKTYYTGLKSTCPRRGGDNNISPLDFTSPVRFDNTYFKLLLWGKGLLNSDEVLLTGKVKKTKELVKSYAENEALFFHHFAKSMVKMGNIKPLTGSKGEIRKNCRRAN
ncbi:peroxidase 9-like isoform X2 [Lycium barbarum]|uniref:peroxidase 9-like isoform X2 n=1 Tax=Lycium barbarum TaxID=112863 RepID=UPI00293EF425|nr:peroxidase 9-like isoform X2 [Lycium barbarum]